MFIFPRACLFGVFFFDLFLRGIFSCLCCGPYLDQIEMSKFSLTELNFKYLFPKMTWKNTLLN